MNVNAVFYSKYITCIVEEGIHTSGSATSEVWFFFISDIGFFYFKTAISKNAKLIKIKRTADSTH